MLEEHIIPVIWTSFAWLALLWSDALGETIRLWWGSDLLHAGLLHTTVNKHFLQYQQEFPVFFMNVFPFDLQ